MKIGTLKAYWWAFRMAALQHKPTHEYYVVYAHERGFGSLIHRRSLPIIFPECISELKESVNESENVRCIILNYKYLRTYWEKNK